MGWLCILGWQATAAAAAFMGGTQIQGLLIINYPGYVYEAWHGTLLAIAVSLFSVMFNTVLARELPLTEGIVLVIHIFAFLGIVVTLWVVSPMADAKAVFTTFSDNGGWGSIGASTIIGITASILPLIGADAAVHMSEEVRDASKAILMSMMWTSVMNGAMGWVMVITLCFSVATMDLNQVFGTSTGYPFSETCAVTLLKLDDKCYYENLSANFRPCGPIRPRCYSHDRVACRHGHVCRNVGHGYGVATNICLCQRQCHSFQPLVRQSVSKMESSSKLHLFHILRDDCPFAHQPRFFDCAQLDHLSCDQRLALELDLLDWLYDLAARDKCTLAPISLQLGALWSAHQYFVGDIPDFRVCTVCCHVKLGPGEYAFFFWDIHLP